MEPSRDVVVIGGGPNGLAAAITCARAGLDTLLVEGEGTVGGGARSKALTLPGFVHDVCSAIHPLALVSPFFRALRLPIEWAYPEIPLAHPLDGGRAALLERQLDDMARSLGAHDGFRWKRVFRPFVERAQDLYDDALLPISIPASPVLLARFGMRAMRSVRRFAEGLFRGEAARALAAGCGAHSFLPMEAPFSAAFALMLGIAGHAVGWPCARAGSQAIVDAMVERLRAHGGTIETGRRIESMRELPPAKAYLFDVFPHALARIAGDRLPKPNREALERFRHAPGIFKIDWALSGPVPWANADVRRAGTVHVGGTLDEIAASEAAANEGRPTDKPFVLFVQQGVMDPSRGHTGWAYAHVPFGSNRDMTNAIEAQIERFAPGFRDCVLARHTMTASQYEAYNPNNAGGDIAGGANDALQLFTRPSLRLYTTAARDIYLCSASTPPGGGVHGMCGYSAAKAALRRVFGKKTFLEES